VRAEKYDYPRPLRRINVVLAYAYAIRFRPCLNPSSSSAAPALPGPRSVSGAPLDGYAPKSKFDIVITAAVMKWMQRWPFRPIANRLWMSKADAIDLPEYAASTR
jgi:hypothetical protein